MPFATRRRGYVLLPVMLAVVLVAAVVVMMAQETGTNIALLNNDLAAARVEYVTQAGLQHGLWQTAEQGCSPSTGPGTQALGADSYTVSLASELGSTNTLTIAVDQDTWIRSDLPTNNYAADSELGLHNETGRVERPLLRFDLTPIAAGTGIVSAVAWFQVTQAHPESPLDIHRVTADWTEAGATWENIGDKLEDVVLASIPPQPTADVWVPVNLTTQVQAWVNGEDNHGIVLLSDVDGVDTGIASRESSDEPYLVVVTGTPPNPAATLTAVGTLANGTSRTLTHQGKLLYQHPDLYRRWQPDPGDGRDTLLRAASPGNNYGIADRLEVRDGTGNDDAHSLLKFDLRTIPVGAKVSRAVLELYQYPDDLAGGDVQVHRVVRAWDEGTQNGSAGDGASWTRYDSSQYWWSPGGDRDPAVIDRVVVPANTAGWFEWDVTGLVHGWVDERYPNHGMILVPGTPGTDAAFRSSDHATQSERPVLKISYTCECGSACIVPHGSGKMVMVVGRDGFNIEPEDEAKKALFESWGYEVEFRDDSLLWLLNVDAFDMAYIASSADAGTVGNWFKGKELGLLIEEGLLNDDYGISTGAGWPVGSAVDVVNNVHPITHPFAAGSLSLYRDAMEGLTTSGSVAPDLQVLAEWDGVAALATLEKGAALAGGGNAAGRRVLLPIGRNQDFSGLNNNGRLILQRALEWAKTDACADTRYADNFDTVSYANDDGSISWKSDWVEVDGGGGGAVSGNVLVTAGRLRLHDNPDTGGTPSATRSVDIDGATAATLQFDFELGSGTDLLGDSAVVEVSTDGTNWTELGAFWIVAGSSGTKSYDLGAHLGTDTRIRFRISGGFGSNDEYLEIDNLNVTACGLVLAKEQKVYWTDDVADKIQRSDEDGSNVEDVLTGLDAPKGIDIDTVNGKLYWTEGAEIRRANLDGSNVETIISASYTTFDVKLDVAGGKVYWTHDASGPIMRANLDGSGQETLATPPGRPAYFSLDLAAGHIYMTEFYSGSVTRIDLDGSNFATITTGPTGAVGSAVSHESGKLYWSGGASNDWLRRSDLDGSDVETIVSGLNAPQDIDYDEDNDRLYWIDALNAVVQRSDPDGSNVETIVSGLSRPRGIVLVDADLVPAGPGSGSGSEPPVTGSCDGTYRDEFGTIGSSGSDGTLDWSSHGWSEVGESDGLGSGDVQIVEDTAFSPGDRYTLRIRDNDNGGEGVERPADLSGAVSATLTFDYRRDGLDGNSDYVAVFASSTGTAGPWTELPAPRIEGAGTDSSPRSYTRDISAFISPNTAIRLRSSPSMGGLDAVFVDNLQIECHP